MKPAERQAARELADKASPGPWVHVRVGDRPPRKCETITQVIAATPKRGRHFGATILRHEAEWLMQPANYRFIIHARTLVPALLTGLDKLEAVAKELAEALAQQTAAFTDDPTALSNAQLVGHYHAIENSLFKAKEALAAYEALKETP